MTEPDYSSHHPEGCRGCPLDKIGRGFCLGSGDPATAKYAVILEAPGSDEIKFELRPNPHRAFLRTKEECDEELRIRRKDYPELSSRWLSIGLPVVGQTGFALQSWIWPKVGIRREECYIDNTIRCLPPKSKSGIQYPTGDTKKAAEHHCRQYDRLSSFRPDTVVFSLHPASLLREITPLPLVIKDFEKIRDFSKQGRRVLALLGGKSTSAFMRYGGNVTRWRGHYQALPSDWAERYRDLFSFEKKTRKKKMLTDDNIWGIPEEVTKKILAKEARPDVLREGHCKQHKRHTYKKRPKCLFAACHNEFERRHHGIQSVSSTGIEGEAGAGPGDGGTS